MPAKNSHKYSIGQELNGLRIVDKIRFGKSNEKGYVVQSLTYPEAPTYRIKEAGLKQGRRDAYVYGSRVFEGNSLYSIVELRPYLVDVEKAKTIRPKSKEKVELKCLDCNNIRKMDACNVSNRDFYCNRCSSNTSYPELFFGAYLDVKGLEHTKQKVFDDFHGFRFDFYIPSIGICETHGNQHFDINSFWYEASKESDNKKREYCIENNINLIELDCSKSSFSFIENKIKENTFLENITKKEKEEMLKIIEYNKKYQIDDIIKLYKSGKSLAQVGKEFGLDYGTIVNILERHNVKSRGMGKRVMCKNNGKIFKSTQEAADWCGLKTRSKIGMVCNGQRKHAGKMNGVPLSWEWMTDL